MKIKYLGLLSCLLICSCDLLKDENYYNVNKDDIREYTNEDFVIRINSVFAEYVIENVSSKPVDEFDSLTTKGYMYFSLWIGNIKSNENINVKAISNFRFYDDNGDILFEKEQVVNDFFNKKYTVHKSYEVYDETCKSNKCFEYSYYNIYPECKLDVNHELTFFNQTMRGEVTFSLLKEDGSYYHIPLRTSINITYIDGITYVEDFSPWYEVEVYKK